MPTAASALDDTLIALADPVRRNIVELLKVQPRRAGELASLLDLNAPVMSKHLKILRGSALVEEERPLDDARARVYRLRPERLEELKDWLSDVGAFWNDQLSSFKAAADAAAGRAAASDSRASDSRKGRRPRKSKASKRR
jgi:DNA-binding transcriptional ArsR family regulator